LLLVRKAALRPLLEEFARRRYGRGGEIAVITDRDQDEYAFVDYVSPATSGKAQSAPPMAYLVDHVGLPGEEEDGVEVHGSLGDATLLCLYRLEELAAAGDMAVVADLLEDHPLVYASLGTSVLEGGEVLQRLFAGYRAEVSKFLGKSPEVREALEVDTEAPEGLANMVCAVRRIVGSQARALEREAFNALLV
jgi:hypothetical protein